MFQSANQRGINFYLWCIPPAGYKVYVFQSTKNRVFVFYVWQQFISFVYLGRFQFAKTRNIIQHYLSRLIPKML
jgi:hypothetical protein